MPSLKDKANGALLGSLAGVDMKTAASTTIFTVPTGKTCRITRVVVRGASGTLAGGTSYSVTNWRQGFSLVNLITATTGYIEVYGVDLTQYTHITAGTAVQFTVTTGATSAATATVDIFGYYV